MKTVTEHIRDSLLKSANAKEAIGTARLLEQLRNIPGLEDFTILMRNRMVMGAFRYGDHVKVKPGTHFCLIGSLRKKLEKYEETGNIEFLVDAANYCFLEFEHGTHENRHFSALDDAVHAISK
jgi:hypothetical protein